MVVRILFAAMAAGILAGLVVAIVHLAKVTPLIQAAEIYETAPTHDHGAGQVAEAAPAAWAPAVGIQRAVFTVIFDVLSGIGFGLLLAAVIILSGRQPAVGEGLLWGLAGFATFTLAPAMGLAPELPGMAAAGLDARQAWWWATVMASAGGLALLVFKRHLAVKGAGVVLLLLPHLAGAPRPDTLMSAVPAGLAASFVAASLMASAIFWLVLGPALAWLLSRQVRAAQTGNRR